jgi:CheY-like chemotaxis protein
MKQMRRVFLADGKPADAIPAREALAGGRVQSCRASVESLPFVERKQSIGKENRKMITESCNPEPSTKRAKMMVVDDDPDLRQALSLRLRANHFDTINVCEGYSAIAMAQKEHPHLIILDLGLPAGDGIAALTLQEYPAFSAIPVIVLTARDPDANETRTLESGAIACFQEAADNEELLGVIRARLQAGGRGGTA